MLWGTICAEESFRLNDLLRKTPVVDNAQSRTRFREGMDILGAKWHYGELKQSMCDTLEHGFNPISDEDADGHKIHNIASKVLPNPINLLIKYTQKSANQRKFQEAYETAKSILYDYATFLHGRSVSVDIDNFNEDLAQFMLIPPSPSSEQKPAKMGFLNAEPADHSSVESSERSKNAIESQSQVSPYLRYKTRLDQIHSQVSQI